ncbi:hypothetical protein AcW2_004254 [Taiwanofungus camphoratus]|nr:hypothetical protein AcW2_004254 [Antrodia cinnamomea]
MDASAKVYSTTTLRLYDFIVLVASNSWAWRCPTGSTILPFFQKNLSENAHLDVGVGTGYYLAASASHLAKAKSITLLDLNPNTLVVAEKRLRNAGYKGSIDKVEQSVFDSIPEAFHSKFDSISLFYLFHCLPGTFPAKGFHVFANLGLALAPNGVLYGATILGQGVHHNWLGRQLMSIYNKKGIFGNSEDSMENLERALRAYFEKVEVRIVGVVALFEARNPLKQSSPF